MSRKYTRVDYELDAKGIRHLPQHEIVAILRGADDLIMSGGRTLLTKVLKGSQDKKVLELGLNESPVYGYYQELTAEQVLARIDWVILHGYLQIEYDWRLPKLVYTPQGWEIERETYARELLLEFDEMLEKRLPPYDMTYLKDRSRDMIFVLLDKVAKSKDPKYIPLLEAWEAIDYKKVRARIREVIEATEGSLTGDGGMLMIVRMWHGRVPTPKGAGLPQIPERTRDPGLPLGGGKLERAHPGAGGRGGHPLHHADLLARPELHPGFRRRGSRAGQILPRRPGFPARIRARGRALPGGGAGLTSRVAKREIRLTSAERGGDFSGPGFLRSQRAR